MNLEENYLDNLLKSVTNPEPNNENDDSTLESIDIDGLDEAISSETETAIAAEFNPDESTIVDDTLELADITPDEILSDDKEETETTLDEINLDEVNLDEMETENTLDELEPDAEGTETTLDEINLDEVGDTMDEQLNLDKEETTLDELNLDKEETTLDELNLDENATSEPLSDDIKLDEISLDLDEDENTSKEESEVLANDSLEDILSMLDDDSELAEINDMLQKADSNEPVQDDMMNLLNQMADNEAQSVNEGVVERDEDDGGVPIPSYNNTTKPQEDVAIEDNVEEMADNSDENVDETAKNMPDEPKLTVEAEVDEEIPYQAEQEISNIATAVKEEKEEKEEAPKQEKSKKEKVKKEKAKKEKKEDNENEEEKKSVLIKIFDFLTQDIIPEPTEEELAAEKEAKEAKKQENLSKKDEAKQAKAEAKKAKAEEKEAAKKVKAEEAAKKKKENAEAKQAKKEAKAAKKAEQEAANKGKKIPKKYFVAAAIFGATVFAAVMISTNILSRQGYLSTARRAFYNEDYMAVYQDTYGMKLDEDESDGLIKARSEVIMKIERRYDSYQNYIKMGRDLEALDALIQGIATYDYINAEAQQYGVIEEVNEIEEDILNTLQAKYGLDEKSARNIMNDESDTEYTIDLNKVLNRN